MVSHRRSKVRAFEFLDNYQVVTFRLILTQNYSEDDEWLITCYICFGPALKQNETRV